MKVYVVCFNDYEGSYYDSVWSTQILAEAYVNAKNAAQPRKPNYSWEETSLDEFLEFLDT